MSRIPALVLTFLCLNVPRVLAQSAENVAVVVNESDAASVHVGDHYVRTRGVPSSNVIRITTRSADVIDRETYISTIETPIARALSKGQLQDRILYIVLAKGIPLRISGTAGREGTGASVDSELTLLYRRMTGRAVPTRGGVPNPYLLGSRDIAEAKPFTHREHDIYLVSRLDAFTVEEAIGLIERAQKPSTDGRIVLDLRDLLRSSQGDKWLAAAATQLSAATGADRVVLEQTAQPARDVADVLGYYGWGSSDPQNRVRSMGLRFVPGAIAATYVNTDARTFKEPPAGWSPTGVATDRKNTFEGSSHGLIGDFVREGVTGVAGHVSEPYFEGVLRPDILFRAYLAGHNLVESFYLAMPQLSWQTVVVGDPLCAAATRTPAPAADLDSAIDPTTTLPTFFSARSLEAFGGSGLDVPPDVARLWLRSRAAGARDDRPLARASLEEAVAKAPQTAALRLDLASMDEQDGNFDQAIAQYERVVALQPKNFVALNNLAYAIAVHRKQPKEAVTFATQALALAPGNPNVIDTVAWIEHLIGDNASAAKRLQEAVQRSPRDANLRLHFAVVLGELGMKARAESELKQALILDPNLDETDQVKQLKLRLASLRQ